MPEYVCDRCHYTTSYKSHFISHLNRKIQCSPIHSSKSIINIADKYNMCSKIINSKVILPPSTVSATSTKKKLMCEYCKKK